MIFDLLQDLKRSNISKIMVFTISSDIHFEEPNSLKGQATVPRIHCGGTGPGSLSSRPRWPHCQRPSRISGHPPFPTKVLACHRGYSLQQSICSVRIRITEISCHKAIQKCRNICGLGCVNCVCARARVTQPSQHILWLETEPEKWFRASRRGPSSFQG